MKTAVEKSYSEFRQAMDAELHPEPPPEQEMPVPRPRLVRIHFKGKPKGHPANKKHGIRYASREESIAARKAYRRQWMKEDRKWKLNRTP